MSRTHLLLAISLVIGFSNLPVMAEQPKTVQAEEATADVLLNAIRANRKALVAVNLGLTDDEAGKFWPLYDRYQTEVNAAGDRQVAVIQDYIANFGSISDEKAMKLVEDYLAADADRLAVRRAYIPQFAGVLSGRKVARLYQIENKMDAVLRYDLASTIPVIEEGAAAPAK